MILATENTDHAFNQEYHISFNILLRQDLELFYATLKMPALFKRSYYYNVSHNSWRILLKNGMFISLMI